MHVTRNLGLVAYLPLDLRSLYKGIVVSTIGSLDGTIDGTVGCVKS